MAAQDIAVENVVLQTPIPAMRAPASGVSVIGRIRQIFFPTLGNSIITLLCLAALFLGLRPLLGWAFIEATWSGNGAACQAHPGGACWAFIATKLRFITFGFYPPEDQWRPAAMMGLCLGMIAVSAMPIFWRRGLLYAWGAVFVAMFVLMYGMPSITTPAFRILGFDVPAFTTPGLTIHGTRQWGGLPLTIMLSTIGLVGAFPVGILLALGRRSELPIVRVLSVAYIELIRGVPLVTVLFMSSILFPLLLPEGATVDKLLRAQVALIMFAAAYIAEIVRGGLQAMPRGQFEAAKALGLSYSLTMRKIILPQALKIVIPALVNTAIGFFKDTTLVIIIGLFDFLNAIKAALTDPGWLGFHIEGYVFAAAVYFCFCFTISRYSLWLEKKLAPERIR